ncbi:MAG: filamentous hemagglutinin N-terminal domain-containing protein [Nostoc sp. ChiQUE01a]|nr:filamentous hemagglutinin N-terminal domain-containing protein [Nostoc sp. ChiQUE01a]
MSSLGWSGWYALSSIVISGISTLLGNCANAQITSDGSLPTNSSIQQQDNTFNISGGTQTGTNLFHSFKEFSVPSGNTAFFDNAANIQNIISRVTGNSISNIDGLITAKGTANLFLINPNGIIFGQNAQLNIGGSFLASTASAVKFADNLEFSATNPQPTTLLSINVPIGLQYGGNPGSILNQSQAFDSSGEFVGFQVKPEKTLALVGGDVVIEGGFLTAPSGRIELGSVGGNSFVSLTPDDTGYTLGYQDVKNFENTSLIQGAYVTTAGNSGGSIQVQSANLTLKDGSQVSAITLGKGMGMGLTVNATFSVQLLGTSADGQYSSGLFTSSEPNATGNAGDLTISTRDLLIQDGARISSTTYGAGKGGNLSVTADSVQVIGVSADGQVGSSLFASSGFGSTGDVGNITINSRNLLTRDGAQIVARTLGIGKGGNLSVTADSVQLIGSFGRYPSGLFTSSIRNILEDTGDTGNLTINTRDLLIRDGAQVSASTFGAGKGGNLFVAADSVQVIGISADGLNASGLFASSNLGATGDAGNLTINTRDLLIRDGAQISTSTFGLGKGGNLFITADSVQVIGTSADGQLASGLFASTGGKGAAGDLTINAGGLLIRDRAQATVESLGEGTAGNIDITAKSVRLNDGHITAQTLFGDGGNLNFNIADLLLMRDGSKISTDAGTAGQGGDGGNITINTPNGFIAAVPNENSDITANAYTGRGGRVNIQAFGVYGIEPRQNPTNLSDITASSELGVEGTIELNTPDIDPNSGLVELPIVAVDTQIAQGCYSPSYAQNSFIITGRGGLPPNPREAFTANTVRPEWATLGPSNDINSQQTIKKNPPIPTPPAQIVEATGWGTNTKGEIVLTANASTGTPHKNWQQSPVTCSSAKSASN